MTGRGTLCAMLVTGLLAGCSSFGSLSFGNPARNADTENDLPFRASLSKGADPRNIAVSVTAPGETSVDEVRESVRFEATKYCLLRFGSSDAEWDLDPTTNDWAFTQSGRVLVFSGRCSGR